MKLIAEFTVFLTMVLLQGAPGFGGDDSAVTTIRVPDWGLQPQAAVDARGRLHLIYFKGEPLHGDVFYVHSDDGARTFSRPVRVNSQPGSVIAIGTVRGPHLALGRNGRVHVAWMGSGKAEPKVSGRQPPMLYTRLADAGDAFEPQRNLIHEHAGLDGGGSIAADQSGNVFVAWHAPKTLGGEEADRRVWLVRSEDDGRTFGGETDITPSVTGACGCCGMRLAADGRGEVFALYRSASEMVHRDVYLLASKDHGRTFQAIATDPWKIGICVMSTGGFAPTSDGVVAAWETQNQIRVKRLDGTDPSTSNIISPPGRSANRKHPCVAINSSGQFIVAWAEDTGWNKGGSVAWQVFDKQGNPEPTHSGRLEGLPAWDAPAAFAASDGTFRILF